MPQFNQFLIDKVSSDISANIPVDEIIRYLEEETRKPVGVSKIALNTLDQSKPNVNPWNHLGLLLLQKKDYVNSEKVWRKIIELAFEQAAERYNNFPPIGLPSNNLALVLRDQGKHNDALIALLDAYRHDVQGGNTGMVARNNFITMFSTVLGEFLNRFTISPISVNRSTKEKQSNSSMEAPTIKFFSLLAWVSFLGPSIFGAWMLSLHPSNWYFLFLVLLGVVSPYFNKKNVKVAFPGANFSIDEVQLPEPQKRQ